MGAKMTAADAANFLGMTLQGVHKALRSHDLPFEKSQNRVFFGHETARALFRCDFHPKTVAFQVVKGGAGKTALAFAVAVRANLYGARVLCVDLDQQGNLTEALGIDAANYPCMLDVLERNMALKEAIVPVGPGLDLVPSRIENAALDEMLMHRRVRLDGVYADLLAPIKDNYDLILLDCPPAIGHSVAAASLASSLVVAPVFPDKFSISGLRMTADEIEGLEKTFRRSIPLCIVYNIHDNRNALSHHVLEALVRHPVYSKKLLKTYIRKCQEFPNSVAAKVSIFESLRESAAKEDVDLLTVELLEVRPQRRATQDSPAQSTELNVAI